MPLRAAAQPAESQPTETAHTRAKESFKVGAAAYAAGEYLAAIQALDAAYSLTPLPAIAFSIAQAERRQYFVDRRPEHLTRSIALFRRYLEQVESGGRRSDALDALSQLEPMAAKLDAAELESTTALPRSAAPSSDRSTRLMVISDAPGARIWIDGVDQSTSPLVREVAPGEHQVAVKAPGFHDSERRVVAVAGELIPISMPLGELPGSVEVQAPGNADIYVDGVYASPGGERVVLKLPSGSHRVSVAQNGHEVATQRIDLARGEAEQVSMTLEPTAQRITSHVLMIGSAATLGVGAALSYLALSSENRAEGFLDKRTRENVSNAELVRYGADVTQRDRYRLMASTSFALSLGLLVTGLFLHELDRPGPEELNRGGFDLTAVVAPGQLGAGFEAAF
jgi:hypothetical protein